jgi:hypothetical protein
MDLSALGATQIPQQLQMQQFLQQQQLNQAPINDLTALTGLGTYSSGQGSTPSFLDQLSKLLSVSMPAIGMAAA